MPTLLLILLALPLVTAVLVAVLGAVGSQARVIRWLCLGSTVAGLVLELTDVYTSAAYPQLNRAARKALECERLATVSAKAKLIKRMDIADNTKTIVACDPKFAKIYLREKEALLEVL